MTVASDKGMASLAYAMAVLEGAPGYVLEEIAQIEAMAPGVMQPSPPPGESELAYRYEGQ